MGQKRPESYAWRLELSELWRPRLREEQPVPQVRRAQTWHPWPFPQSDPWTLLRMMKGRRDVVSFWRTCGCPRERTRAVCHVISCPQVLFGFVACYLKHGTKPYHM